MESESFVSPSWSCLVVKSESLLVCSGLLGCRVGVTAGGVGVTQLWSWSPLVVGSELLVAELELLLVES